MKLRIPHTHFCCSLVVCLSACCLFVSSHPISLQIGMSLRALSPAGRLGKRARTNFDSDSDDSPKTSDDPFGGSSPLKDPPSALGKQGLSSMESIAAATEQVATTLATGLMHAVSNATRALGVAVQTKLDAMQSIADGIKSQLRGHSCHHQHRLARNWHIRYSHSRGKGGRAG